MTSQDHYNIEKPLGRCSVGEVIYSPFMKVTYKKPDKDKIKLEIKIKSGCVIVKGDI